MAGPRGFAGGAWRHSVLGTEGPRTGRRGGGPRAGPGIAEGVGQHPGSGTPRGLDHTQTRASPGGWTTPRLGHPQGVGPHPRPGSPRGWAAAMGALREARSQLAAERTPDSPDGTAPPLAGSPDNGAPPLGGKLSRSLRSLRPIAAASVVAGPRRFPEGA